MANTENQEAVTSALSEQDGPIGIKKVAEAASLSQSDARTALTELIASGEVVKDGNKGYILTPRAEATEDEEAVQSGGMLLHRRSGVGEHDESVYQTVQEMEGAGTDGDGVTIKAVSEATNLRVRILENVLWRLDTKHGVLELVEGSRPKRYRVKAKADA